MRIGVPFLEGPWRRKEGRGVYLRRDSLRKVIARIVGGYEILSLGNVLDTGLCSGLLALGKQCDLFRPDQRQQLETFRHNKIKIKNKTETK